MSADVVSTGLESTRMSHSRTYRGPASVGVRSRVAQIGRWGLMVALESCADVEWLETVCGKPARRMLRPHRDIGITDPSDH